MFSTSLPEDCVKEASVFEVVGIDLCGPLYLKGAPWWGGFWERLIRMLKTILRKVLARAYLNQKEMTTVLCDAESVLNSRPLIYICEDSDEFIALSPSVYLQEIREVGVPDLDYIDSKKLNKRFIYKQKILQDLRLQFRNEYLGQLKDFSKVQKASSIKERDIVLVGDTNSKRINWPLGKVKKIYPGKDGIVCVVEIKTKNGTFLRPIQRHYPLEVGEPGNFPFPGEPTPSVADGHSTRVTPSVPDPVSTKTDHQDPLVRRSRYGRILNPTKT
ncbi:uncharacterized protein TNCV_2513291 [Trichonephila clavipes]|nr:uncharacterized protein TNCV_2513291 [Trichonephila clavipes]